MKSSKDNKSAAPGKTGEQKAAFIDRIKSHLNIIIPSAAVFLCAVVVLFLINAEISDLTAIRGKFVSVSSDSEDYAVFEKNGSYTLCFADGEISGVWQRSGDDISLVQNDGKGPGTAYYIDSKYIAFDDDDFLKGSVPDGSLFDAQFTAADGTVYVFDSNGKCHTEAEGRNTELGGYITDGNFIVITIDNVAHTYLNCGDGISPVYYTRS